MHKATKEKLKLGKGAAFVKSRLRYLPQENDVWEAGFGAIPKGRRAEAYWLGVAVSVTDRFVLATWFSESATSVNALAKLLADAMRRPFVEGSHRPKCIRLQPMPEWDELVPHLEDLGIEVTRQASLPKVEKEVAFFRKLTGKGRK